MNILDLSAAVLIGLIAAAFLMMTGDLGRTAALFPKILAVTIIVLVVLYVGVQLYLRFRTSAAQTAGSGAAGRKAAGGASRSGRWYVVIGAIVVYMALIPLIGFAAASFVFGIVLPFFGGYRRMLVIVPVALGMTIGLVVIGMVFNIPLPSGVWMDIFGR